MDINVDSHKLLGVEVVVRAAKLLSSSETNLLRVNLDSISEHEELLVVPGVDFEEFEVDTDEIVGWKNELLDHGAAFPENVVASEDADVATSCHKLLLVRLYDTPSI